MICSLEPKRDAYEVWELGMEGAAYGRWKVNKRCSLRFLFIKVFEKSNDEKANKRLPLRYKDRAC
jgi:hypothetical protein